MKKQNKIKVKKYKLPFYTLLFIALLTPLSSHAQNTVTLNLKNVSLIDFFNEVEKNTDIRFSFVDHQLDSKKDISIKITNAPIDLVLSKILTPRGYEYTRTGNTYAITRKTIKQDTKQKYSGLVTDEKGSPIIGANITVKGQNEGTITDINGNYELSVEPNSILLFTYIGYIPKEVITERNTLISVTLVENNALLDEVVVVGYGVKKKRDVIGSVVSVKSDDLNKSGSLDVINNLQGKASGLNIFNSAAGNQVMVRGIHSINSGNDPLWVVDGIPSGPPNSEDVESIEVLKDASATAIYGSRGSNGVIIVTTKRGKEGKTDLSLNVHSGANVVQKTDADMNYANNIQWFNIMDYASVNSNVAPFDPMTLLNEDSRFITTHISADEARLVRDNWFNAITRPGNYINASLSLSTGNQNGKTYMNANFRKSLGNLLGNDDNEINFRINSDYKVNKLVTVGAQLHISRGERNGDGNSTVRLAPWQPLYNSTDPERTGYWNPHNNILTAVNPKYRQLRNDYLRFLGGINVEIKLPFVEGLSLRSEYNVNIGVNNSTDWQSALVNPVTASEAGSKATEQTITGQTNHVNAYFKYNNTFGKHVITGVAGVESERNNGYVRIASGKNLTTEYAQLGTTPGVLIQAQGYSTEGYLFSAFGRADYKYDDKYLFGLSFREDGSSLFDPEYRWGTFTAYSIGWILSDEKFLKQYDWLSLLKLRGSMGQTGNNSIPQNKNLTTYETNVNFGYGEETVISGGTKPTTIGNNSLTWETTASYDIGIDYGFLNNRLTGSIAYYFQDVNGLVLAASVPKSTGLSGNQEIWGNLGQIYNHGFEFNISSVNIDQKKIKWTTDFNFSTSKNKVVNLINELDNKGIPIYHDENSVVGLVTKTGGQVREFYMPEYAGVDVDKGVEMIYELDQATFDQTGETVRTGRLIPATQTNLQNNRFVLSGRTINPTFYGGLSNTVSYQNFDLNFLISFSGGNFIYDNEMAKMANPGTGRNGLYTNLIEESWKNPGDNNKYPRLVYNYTQPWDWDHDIINSESPTGKGNWVESNGNYTIQSGTHSKYLYRGDYLKLKHVQLGYSFPEPFLSKIGIKSFRAYIAADNLYTLTVYPGWDPQSGFLRGGIVGLQNYTLNPFMVTATFLAGLQVKL